MLVIVLGNTTRLTQLYTGMSLLFIFQNNSKSVPIICWVNADFLLAVFPETDSKFVYILPDACCVSSRWFQVCQYIIFAARYFLVEWQFVITASLPPAASWLTGKLRTWISPLVFLFSGPCHALYIDHQRVWIQLLIITLLGAICSRSAICIAGQHTASSSYRCCRFGNPTYLMRGQSSEQYHLTYMTFYWW